MISFLGVFIPFFGTALGAACVVFMKREIRPNFQKALLGFASGVMVAASVWSLLLPSIQLSESMRFSFLPAAIGFALGMVFLLCMDVLIPHLHVDKSEPEGIPTTLKKSTMLILAVTIHNIPEGMAVGVVFAGLAAKTPGITLAGAMALAIGIGIQNFPEGAIISLPLSSEGITKRKAFFYGIASGMIEAVSAALTLLLSQFVEPILPYMLSFAAGAMLYVVVEELIPESAQKPHSNMGTIGFALGFLIMMILDVALG